MVLGMLAERSGVPSSTQLTADGPHCPTCRGSVWHIWCIQTAGMFEQTVLPAAKQWLIALRCPVCRHTTDGRKGIYCGCCLQVQGLYKLRFVGQQTVQTGLVSRIGVCWSAAV